MLCKDCVYYEEAYVDSRLGDIHANRQTLPSVCGYLSCALFRCRCRL